MRLAFLNTYAAHEVLPDVVRIMAEELKWSSAEQRCQLEAARRYIDLEMGQLAKSNSASNVALNLTKEEMQTAKERFNQLDKDRKGHITVNDIRRHFRVGEDFELYLKCCSGS